MLRVSDRCGLSPKVDIYPTLAFETEAVTMEPTDWPTGRPASLLGSSLCQGFSVGAGNPNSGCHTCLVGILPTKSASWVLNFFLMILISFNNLAFEGELYPLLLDSSKHKSLL